MSIIEEWELPQPPKFKVGDKVKLSEKAINFFSRDNWTKYKVPYAMFLGDYGTVVEVRWGTRTIEESKTEFYVQNGSGTVFYHADDLEIVEEQQGQSNIEQAPKEQQYTGGSSDYYKVFVKNPTTLSESYYAECNDIIEALEMDFAEGNAFKAIWRKAKARQGVKKKGYDNGVYDSEKIIWFGERMLVKAKRDSDEQGT